MRKKMKIRQNLKHLFLSISIFFATLTFYQLFIIEKIDKAFYSFLIISLLASSYFLFKNIRESWK